MILGSDRRSWGSTRERTGPDLDFLSFPREPANSIFSPYQAAFCSCLTPFPCFASYISGQQDLLLSDLCPLMQHLIVMGKCGALGWCREPLANGLDSAYFREDPLPSLPPPAFCNGAALSPRASWLYSATSFRDRWSLRCMNNSHKVVWKSSRNFLLPLGKCHLMFLR